ncbi:MAG TPA: peptidylprolyl isomerase [Chitinophagaceae bacterium]|nr:peptidylprolyl isomerase [Chitinophagaceae bacterium]
MSIIQSLRDKSAVLLTGLIAISLLGFLVQDAFIGRTSGLMSGPSSSVGSINGTDIDAQDFNEKVRMMEESNRQQGIQSSEMMTQNIVENVWTTYIQENLIRTEAKKLGISFTAKEMSELLFSENAPQEFKQLFTDPNTGQFNVQAARTWFSNVKKSKQTEEVNMVNSQLIEPLIVRQLAEKYSSLIGQASYIPKWMVEKLNTDNSQFVSMNYVMVPYTNVPDSAVKVTDEDINKFVQAHKDEFKQEKTRSIAYVVFDANPTSADSAAVYGKLESLKEELRNTADAKGLVARNGSSIPFFDGYVLKNRLAMDAKDSIVSLPVGSVVGPYLDGGSYVIAKKLDVRSVPDSVKVRHILIGVVDPRTGQPRRSDSAAKKTADSLFAAIKSGADFRTLAQTFSEDEGSKNNGGEYNFSSQDLNLAKPFYDYSFYQPAGSRDIVKTDFGYHIMEVMNQKNFEESYKMAYISKPILSSVETDNAASSAATQFAGNSRDVKSFDANASKNGLNKRLADNIKEIDYTISGMPSRAFVKWIWENEVGTVSEPFDFKDKYVVAVITGAYEEGVQSAATARVMVEPLIRNQKKAEILKTKIGSANTLEAIAAATQQQVGQVDTLRFGDQFIPNVGPEVKVIGAAFNKENQAKVSGLIEGQSGVFAVKTNSIGALPNLAADVETQRKNMQMQMRQFTTYGSFDALKKAAKIEDTRRAAGF